MKIWNQWKYLQNFQLRILTPTRSCRGNLLQDYEHKFERLPEDQKLSKLCCDAGLKIVDKGQFLHYTWWRRRTQWNEESSRNSRNFLNERNWTNSAPMLVSRRILRKDDSSLHLMMHLTIWKVFFTLKWWIIPRERVDPWKTGCEGLLSWRTLRCGDHDRIFISWQNCLLGSYRERNQQVRNRNVRRDSCCKCWGQKYRETCREGTTTTVTDFHVVFCV